MQRGIVDAGEELGQQATKRKRGVSMGRREREKKWWRGRSGKWWGLSSLIGVSRATDGPMDQKEANGPRTKEDKE